MKKLAYNPAGLPGGALNGNDQSSPSRPIDWRRYVLFLRKWWWIPTVSALIGAGLQAFLLARQADQWVSTARMWVSGKLQLPEGRLYQEEVQNFFGTQIAVMQGAQIIARARHLTSRALPDRQPVPVETKISPLPRTSILVLQAIGPDPEYVQAFLNALMDEYTRTKRYFREKTTEDALSAAIGDLKARQGELAIEQDKLEQFKKANDIVVLQAQGDAAGSRLSQLNIQREDLARELLLLNSAASLEQSLDLKEGSSSSAPILTNLMAQFEAAKQNSRSAQEFFNTLQAIETMKVLRDELSVNLRPKHPKIIKLNEDIARTEKLLEFHRLKSREELAAARQRLEQQIQFVQQSITNWEAKATEANLHLTEYERSRANVQRLQTICDELTKTVQKVDLDKALAQETLTRLDDASAGAQISKPWLKKIAVGLIAGLLAGALVVYLVERFDDRVMPSTDLASEFDLNIVGRVPEVELLPSPEKAKALPRPRDRQLFTESYRNLRSSLLFMPTRDRRPRTIIITSAVPYEGKSTVTVNLAEMLANAGCRVLLIDGDLRRGQLQKFFQLPGEPGLCDLLQGQVDVRQAILPTAQENLFFLPVGKAGPAPGELFLSARTEDILKQLASQYEFVLIDTAPILATDDTTSLAPKTDGVLFVVRESFSKAGMIRPAIEQLLQRQAKVLGLIVNRADSSAREYCYYKYAEYYGST